MMIKKPSIFLNIFLKYIFYCKFLKYIYIYIIFLYIYSIWAIFEGWRAWNAVYKFRGGTPSSSQQP